MSQSQVWNQSKLRAQNPARWAVWYLPGGQFWHVLDIQCQIDLGPSLGKKLSQAIEIHSKIITKSSKIWKTRKSRKTAENIMSDQIFDVQKKFSLCWRSKNRSGDQPPRILICFVSRKKEFFVGNKYKTKHSCTWKQSNLRYIACFTLEILFAVAWDYVAFLFHVLTRWDAHTVDQNAHENRFRIVIRCSNKICLQVHKPS